MELVTYVGVTAVLFGLGIAFIENEDGAWLGWLVICASWPLIIPLVAFVLAFLLMSAPFYFIGLGIKRLAKGWK